MGMRLVLTAGLSRHKKQYCLAQASRFSLSLILFHLEFPLVLTFSHKTCRVKTSVWCEGCDYSEADFVCEMWFSFRAVLLI
ncbi:hypothetical protein Micbo1qcDRAFT_160861 [Microdochium bolleyi]|uniref:Uncharacterized protein n=1 Tax=Microdochium bolleyi TaxID=196109 RepID=A0A136J780_9PEZI|nr:hypothetical protein Micbo1qcDRAFT_160861 [Microdochium bolleyi]